jgi:uncharacterized SAM-binding protein YcdF (DUF218 family)
MRVRRLIIRLLIVGISVFMALGWWIGWGSWPNDDPKVIPWTPDAIVVLGGGNEERPREALRLHNDYPEIPILITGDGGTIHQALLDAKLPSEALIHETAATSTVENAEFTAPLLSDLGVERVVLVTNGFHAPRALAVFRRYQPHREFAASFEPPPERETPWYTYCRRRERMAALLYVFTHGIWSF